MAFAIASDVATVSPFTAVISSPICKPAACAVSSTCATFGTTAFTPMALMNSAITRNAITKFISGPLNTVIARFQTGWLLNARGSFFFSSSP